jgi:hypothetical protein
MQYVINICMVRIAMRNIVPGSIMTAEGLYCQRNQVRCQKNLWKSALLGCSLCYSFHADDPETWLRIREIQPTAFGCCSLTIRLDCLLLQLQVFGILE